MSADILPRNDNEHTLPQEPTEPQRRLYQAGLDCGLRCTPLPRFCFEMKRRISSSEGGVRLNT